MRSTFERDTLYPWSVQAIGESFVPQNLQTGEKLPGHPTYSLAHKALTDHLAKVANGVNVAADAVAR